MLLNESDGNVRALRMDGVGDAGNDHGFHIITLYPNGERESEWIPLPR